MWRQKGKTDEAASDPYGRARDRMVDKQIRSRGVKAPRVLDAMRAVPRHCFVPEGLIDSAYEDHPLNIGSGQTISQPYIVALMTELLNLQPGDRVLEIGTGSGYQTAVLATLAGVVTSVERLEELADAARGRLAGLGYDNVQVHRSDGTLGFPEEAPYDAIVVTAAAPHVPEALTEQLADGGRLVCPVGPRMTQRLVRIVRRGSVLEQNEGIGCVFVPLVGENGWAS